MRTENHEKTPRPTPRAKPPAPAAVGTNSRGPTRKEMKSVQFRKSAGFAAPCSKPVRTGSRKRPSAAGAEAGAGMKPRREGQQASLVATGFSSVLPLGAGQYSTVVEGYFAMPDINLLGFPDSGGGYYVRFLF